MAEYAGLVDWRRQQVPALIGLSGALLVGFNNTAAGFVLITAALLYAGYNSDAAMRDKTDSY
ncbi:MAG: hypothetical protein V1835_02705 [Candidatus Micrarchaeota archaeon]